VGSKNFDVTVTACHGTTASLRIDAADDQQWAAAAEDLAIRLLEEAAGEFAERGGALAEEVSFDDTMDEEWLHRFARGFIRSVRVTDETAGRHPSGMLHIEVTHPAWLEHIREGDKWESYAYDEPMEFADCVPIAPSGSVATIDDPGDSFMYVPRAAWVGYLPSGPDLLEIAAYAPTAYTTGDTIDDPKRIPADWIGRAVRVTSIHGDIEDGTLIDQNTYATMDAFGSYGVRSNAIKSVARLVPKAGRRGAKARYAKTFDHIPAELVDAQQSGRKIELVFRIPPDRRELALYEPYQVLDLLAQDWQARYNPDEQDERTKLAKAVAVDNERLGAASHDRYRMLERIADTYIADYTITYEPGKDLDNLPQEDVYAILTAEWPKATLTITMTDERWATLPADDGWPRNLHTRAIADRT
jgi:hypothetical protein